VRTERPWPDAGWPVRFEWLHGLGLFAAVSLAIAALVASDADATPGDPDRAAR
jgi:arabinofuranan 3-O-arabinosyltransferase